MTLLIWRDFKLNDKFVIPYDFPINVAERAISFVNT